MSAKETRFPRTSYSKPTTTKKDRDAWFKRCMEDFLRYPVIGRGDPWTWQEYEAWFKKWFSQFKEEP